jgi:UDP-N-acetylmuramate dehydrogenase
VFEKPNVKRRDLLMKIKGEVLFSEPMRDHTTFRVGGPADILIIPKDLDDIKYSITYAKEKGIPLSVIGNGSKLLVSDKGIRGIVIKIASTLDNVGVSGERMIAEAGCPLSELIKIATRNNLSGIEFATGIPGTLGGAIATNAGTHEGSMSAIVKSVTVMDPVNGLLRIFTKDDCRFGYRESVFGQKRLIILKAEMKMKRSAQKEIEKKISELREMRKRTQPTNKCSAGSIFKNPSGISAGKLVDAAGIKGCRKGDAQISHTHGNFIVNLGRAKASDVTFLMKLAQEKVEEKTGVELKPEIVFLGDFE